MMSDKNQQMAMQLQQMRQKLQNITMQKEETETEKQEIERASTNWRIRKTRNCTRTWATS
ncbi:MAG: hypothetical protein SVU32_02120 [Candidatus Nanohaloarchaea archaeon]|nr:hypothetical protein [Candidatus Nanohaloarchaea archaeon]